MNAMIMKATLVAGVSVAMLSGASGLTAQAPDGQDAPSDPPAMDHGAMDQGDMDGGGMMGMMGQGGMGMMMRMQGGMDGQMMQMMGRGRMDSGMMEMMERGMGVMDTGGPAPESILMMGDALGLTDEQRAELEAVQTRYREASGPMMAGIQESLDRAEVLLDGEAPDLVAYRDALQDAVDELVVAQVAMAEAAVEARAILTEEQRAELDMGLRMMQGMMGTGGGGGMMDGGMSH